jgi:hypothetical protein
MHTAKYCTPNSDCVIIQHRIQSHRQILIQLLILLRTYSECGVMLSTTQAQSPQMSQWNINM